MSIKPPIGGFNNNGPTPSTYGKVTGVLAPQPSITAFRAGTQKPLPTPFNNTLKASSVPGIPTAAGRSDLQGADYFKNLVAQGNPAEQIAGKTGLSHPGMLPQHPVKSIASSTTNVDGSKTDTTHTFDTNSNPVKPSNVPNTPEPSAPTNTTVPGTNGNNGTDFQKNLANVQTTGLMTPEEKAANEEVARANKELKGYQNVQALSPYAEANMYSDRARTPAEIQDLERSPDLAGRANATQGLLGSLGNIYGTADVSGANARLQGIQTQAQRNLSAQNSVAGYTQPQFGVQYGTQVGQPGQPNGGIDTNSFGGGIQAPANIASIQGLTGKVNDIQATSPAADAAFSVLNNYAKGIGANTPITSGLAQLYGSTAQGNQAVAGFKAQLQAVRSAWQAIEGGDATLGIPDNVTPAQLTQIQQQLKTDAQNKTTGFQDQINKLKGTSSGGSTGGTLFGSFF